MKVKPIARPPSRRRGELRVAALLDAASAVFSEKSYDAATMTEIAARAGAAIGSLYQFFPSKEALADALLARYAERIGAGLRSLSGRSTPQSLAADLVKLILGLRSERTAALALMDAPGADSGRARVRRVMRQEITTLLQESSPELPLPRAKAKALLVIQLLKLTRTVDAADPRRQMDLVRDAQQLLQHYLAG